MVGRRDVCCAVLKQGKWVRNVIGSIHRPVESLASLPVIMQSRGLLNYHEFVLVLVGRRLNEFRQAPPMLLMLAAPLWAAFLIRHRFFVHAIVVADCEPF